MKKVVIGMVIGLLAMGIQNVVGAPPSAEEEGGGQVPAFSIDDYQGKTVKLADFKGKVLIIHHLSPGCSTCNDQINATKAMREKYGKDNLKVIAFIYDGTFNDDSDREAKRDMVKNIVERGIPAEKGGKSIQMDFDAYIVWSYATYAQHSGNLTFKKEPLLTCVIDKGGNFVYKKTDTDANKEKLDKYLSKLLKPIKKKEDKK